MNDFENFLKYIALLTLIYNIFNNNYQLKLERKRYWYREHFLKKIFILLDELKILSLDFIDKKNEALKNSQRISCNEVTDKLNEIRECIKVLEYFVPTLILMLKFERLNMCNRLLSRIDLIENKLFNMAKESNLEDIKNFYRDIKREIYIYEKKNYKIYWII